MASLSEKKALITASGQGIGRASALAFARAGASVVATDINAEALDSLAAEAKAEGLMLETRVLDVLKDEAVEAIVAETGPFDILFNCAGVVHGGTVMDMTAGDLDFAFDLNVRAMIRTIRAVAVEASARPWTGIATASSITGCSRSETWRKRTARSYRGLTRRKRS
ncbi:hypothetical protein C0075_01215 [Rhizobium sp. KAs_5_22]|nr:hypothetical protein C0075_01215 [Rhizobium sp. KAs_5_22]